jgi:cell shape-determining protein MreC
MRKIFLIIKSWSLGLKIMWIIWFLNISISILGSIYHFKSTYITTFLFLIQAIIFFVEIIKSRKRSREHRLKINALKKELQEIQEKHGELIQIGKALENLRVKIQNLKEWEKQKLN